MSVHRSGLDKGIELIAERPGVGRRAARGCVVVYNARLFLHRGDEVTPDAKTVAQYRERLSIRSIDDVELIDHLTTLGRRQCIAAIEKTLYGMQAGGYREILAAPHLCYGERGVGDLIPPNAMLHIKLWVQAVE